MLLICAALCLGTCREIEANASAEEQFEPTALEVGDLADDVPLTLGVQTHFSQNWPVGKLMLVDAVNAPVIRDSLPWPSVGQSDGTVVIAGPVVDKLDKACSQGVRLILTTKARYQAVDRGRLISKPTAKAAFGKYVAALADHFGSCLAGIEIGNEINAVGALETAGGTDQIRNYVDVVATAKKALSDWPDVVVLGGSSNQIATGFLGELFDAGLLEWADAIAVHPYRRQYYGIDFEIANLRRVMRKSGKVLPIWVTEFSPDNSSSTANGEQMLIGVTLMASAGVRHFSWYALIKQAWFPDMGLFDGADINSAGLTFRLLQNELLIRGTPVRVKYGNGLFVYRYGSDALVVWGLRQNIVLPPGAKVLDAQGRLTGQTDRFVIDAHPRIILGASDVEQGAPIDLADTMIEYPDGAWSYHALRANREARLTWTDGRWDSHYASRWHKPLYVRPTGGATAGAGKSGSQAIWRYVQNASEPDDLRLAFCALKGPTGDGVTISIFDGDRLRLKKVLTGGQIRVSVPLSQKQGRNVDLRVGQNNASGGDTFKLRAVITRDDWLPDCP